MRRHSSNPFDLVREEPLSFADVTVLVFVAVSLVAVAALLGLGTLSAAHRIAGVLGSA